MNADYSILGNVLRVRVRGRLDTVASPGLDKLLAEALAAGGITEIHFDLGELEYISSSGLRVLLAALKKTGTPVGAGYIENANDDIKNIFEMTGFDSLFGMS